MPTQHQSAVRVAEMHLAIRFPTMPRSSYLPPAVRGTEPNVDPEGTDLAIWTWEESNRDETVRPYGIAFQAEQNKPLWHNWFRTPEQRQRQIDVTIADRKSAMARKEEKKKERREWVHDLKVGDVLVSSWGYDQTNIDYYEVTDVVGKSIVIREIASKVVRGEVPHNYVVPAPGHFAGPPMKKIPQKGYQNSSYVKVRSFANAYKWDGKPDMETMSEYGH